MRIHTRCRLWLVLVAASLCGAACSTPTTKPVATGQETAAMDEAPATTTRDDGTQVLETGTWLGRIEVGPAGPPDSKAAEWEVVRLIPLDGSPAHILDLATDDALRQHDGETVTIVGSVILPAPRTDIATLGGSFLEVDSFTVELTGAPPDLMDDGFSSSYSGEIELFEATVRIDARRGGKRFQGVWLDRDDGGSYLVSYRATDDWRAFEGQRVEIAGERYSPGYNTQHIINAQHFEVHGVELADSTYPPTITGEPRTVAGTVRSSGGEGSKSAVLVTLDTDDGGSIVLRYGRNPFWESLDGRRVEVTGREFTPGHPQQVGGEHLWPDALRYQD